MDSCVLRHRKIFMFLLNMPIAFTLLFGFASGAFNRAGTDPRLPVGFLDEDHNRLSRFRQDLLASPQVIRLHAEQLNARPAWKQCSLVKNWPLYPPQS